jgi:hypothetical protein
MAMLAILSSAFQNQILIRPCAVCSAERYAGSSSASSDLPVQDGVLFTGTREEPTNLNEGNNSRFYGALDRRSRVPSSLQIDDEIILFDRDLERLSHVGALEELQARFD